MVRSRADGAVRPVVGGGGGGVDDRLTENDSWEDSSVLIFAIGLMYEENHFSVSTFFFLVKQDQNKGDPYSLN